MAKKKAADPEFAPQVLAAWNRLSPMQREFARQFSVLRDATAAAKKAGYKGASLANSYRYVRKPSIKLVIDALCGSDAKPSAGFMPAAAPLDLLEAKGSVDWALSLLIGIAESSDFGNTRIAAVREICLIRGHYAPKKIDGKVEHNHTVRTIRGLLDEIDGAGTGLSKPLIDESRVTQH